MRKIQAIVTGLIVACGLATAPISSAELTPEQLKDLRLKLQQQRRAQERNADQRAGAQGGATFIACPVERLRTEVVSDLPKPWWQTPQVGGLVETRVQRIGGDPTLVCAYRGYGGTVSVMRRPPRGMTCRSRDGGFSCR